MAIPTPFPGCHDICTAVARTPIAPSVWQVVDMWLARTQTQASVYIDLIFRKHDSVLYRAERPLHSTWTDVEKYLRTYLLPWFHFGEYWSGQNSN